MEEEEEGGVAWLLPILQSQHFQLFSSWATVGCKYSCVNWNSGDYSPKDPPLASELAGQRGRGERKTSGRLSQRFRGRANTAEGGAELAFHFSQVNQSERRFLKVAFNTYFHFHAYASRARCNKNWTDFF